MKKTALGHCAHQYFVPESGIEDRNQRLFGNFQLLKKKKKRGGGPTPILKGKVGTIFRVFKRKKKSQTWGLHAKQRFVFSRRVLTALWHWAEGDDSRDQIGPLHLISVKPLAPRLERNKR